MKTEFKPEDVSISSMYVPLGGGLGVGNPNGIKLIYFPTGVVFTCEEHKSQRRNGAACIDQLEGYLRKAQFDDVYRQNNKPYTSKPRAGMSITYCMEQLEEYLNVPKLVKFSNYYQCSASSTDASEGYVLKNPNSLVTVALQDTPSNSFRKVLDDATEAGKIGEVPPSIVTSEDFIKWLKEEIKYE